MDANKPDWQMLRFDLGLSSGNDGSEVSSYVPNRCLGFYPLNGRLEEAVNASWIDQERLVVDIENSWK